MKTTIHHSSGDLQIDLSQFFDLSIAISPLGPRAWYVQPVVIKPVINRYFTGSVQLGGAVNFRDIQFNPHGHGTHTECVGHISKEWISVNEELKSFFFLAELITVEPAIAQENKGHTVAGDRLITREQLEKALKNTLAEAVIIRTKPNDRSKIGANYSDTNFCYMETSALALLAERGIKHLLLDLPSVDRESDGGLLLGHRAFWNYPAATRRDCTITEMIYVPDEAKDGVYFINLQVAAFDNDAAPSRPLLFPLL